MHLVNTMQSGRQNRCPGRSRWVRGFTLATAALGLAAGNLVMAGPSSAAPLDVNAAVAQMNAARNRVACPSLSVNGALNEAAQAHSADMARTLRKLTSTGSDKSTPATRAADAGYEPRSVGEVVFMAPPSATTEEVVNAWLNGGSKQYILNCAFTDIGIGIASGPNSQSYWTADLARPK